MLGRRTAERSPVIENRLRVLRQDKGLSQAALAERAGVTRQAIYAIEMNEYLPSTAIALRLAEILGCRVEDLFSLASEGEVVEGEWLGAGTRASGDRGGGRPGERVTVARVGRRLVVRPVSALGDVLTFTVRADGLLLGAAGRRAKVRLLRDRRAIEEEVVVAGCDPSIFLAGQHLRRQKDLTPVIGWSMGSGAALQALERGEVHAAGVHVRDARSGEWNLPYVRRRLKNRAVRIVTFAAWTEGWILPRGNPKRIRAVEDLARRDVAIVNREEASGARLLLDQQLAAAGIPSRQVRGYDRLARSHLEVARLIAEGHADVGVGVEAAARIAGLDFVPLQAERYDLVIPSELFQSHPGLARLLDTLMSRPFRAELEALGGYDTTDTGKELDPAGAPRPRNTRPPSRSR